MPEMTMAAGTDKVVPHTPATARKDTGAQGCPMLGWYTPSLCPCHFQPQAKRHAPPQSC
jgi:hypothetical protein